MAGNVGLGRAKLIDDLRDAHLLLADSAHDFQPHQRGEHAKACRERLEYIVGIFQVCTHGFLLVLILYAHMRMVNKTIT